MSWGSVIAGGAAIIGGVISSQGAKNAAGAESDATSAAAAEQRHEFDTLLSLTAPQRSIGNQALATLGGVYGYSPTSDPITDNRQVGTRVFKPSEIGSLLKQGMSVDDILRLGVFEPGAKTSDISNLMRTYGLNASDINRLQNGIFSPSAPVTIDHATGKPIGPADYTNFFASPDYKFRFNQGESAVQNSAAAGPAGLYSGNTLRALTDYGQGMGANEFDNWFKRQAALAGIGQAATSQAGAGALVTGANVGNLLVNQGNARASGIIGQTNSITNLVNELAKLWGSRSKGSGGFGSGLPGTTVWNDASQPMSGVPA